MEIYSIGFTQKTAAQFFSLLQQHGIRRLLDVRLNNVSQLAGFAKRDDLKFFLHEICNADYIHDPTLAPTQEMLDRYKKEKTTPWSEYESAFLALITQRKIESTLDPAIFNIPTVLLCSEPTPENCHRRLVLEYLQNHWPTHNIHITHL
ncbi:MAG TPA: DUF488 domain-containing protein [Candidatus Acidoferrum sp.]|jgi:uncharacterized protein (DUF488 family)